VTEKNLQWIYFPLPKKAERIQRRMQRDFEESSVWSEQLKPFDKLEMFMQWSDTRLAIEDMHRRRHVIFARSFFSLKRNRNS
jgi:hypothetical protein